MRNPLARLVHRDPAKRTLRERLTATKAKARQVLAVNRALLKIHPIPAPQPAVDKAALVNYATWLAFERERVCAELYPHMGGKASRFVLTQNAAERFFYPDGISDGRSKAWRTVPPASSRAVKVLDLVGVDWRQDTDENSRRFFDEGDRADNGERPALPFAWPEPDAALLEALDDLERLDAALSAFHDVGTDERDGDEAPGYAALEEARNAVLERLAKERATTLSGLQIKARTLLRASVDGTNSHERAAIIKSLLHDLLGTNARDFEPRPDPITPALEECRRLQRVWSDTFNLPQPAGRVAPLPEQDAAADAFNNHRVNVLLKTVPRSAAGCAALARYALEYEAEHGTPFDEDPQGNQSRRILALIARSPLL